MIDRCELPFCPFDEIPLRVLCRYELLPSIFRTVTAPPTSATGKEDMIVYNYRPRPILYLQDQDVTNRLTLYYSIVNGCSTNSRIFCVGASAYDVVDDFVASRRTGDGEYCVIDIPSFCVARHYKNRVV